MTDSQERLFEEMSALRGAYLGLPVLKGATWVFGGGLKNPDVTLEVGSFWSWLSYGESVFDAAGLSQEASSRHFVRLASEALRIEQISWSRGTYFQVVTGDHCCLEIRPSSAFDPHGIKGLPLRVRVKRGGEEVYTDWNSGTRP